MRYIELLPGLKSSALGFGCSSVLGVEGEYRAKQAIHAALDAGINHFDLAPSYESGAAERFLGRELKERRDQVTLVTKFGLRPRPWLAWLQPLKPLVRRLRGQPGMSCPASRPHPLALSRGKPGSVTSFQYRRIPMTPAAMRHNLEASLRAMRTEYIDVFLMHEPPLVELWAELRACAEELKRAGKIRGWGIAAPALPEKSYSSGLDVLQTSAEWELSVPVQSRLNASGSGLILFSPLRGVAAEQVPVRLATLWRMFPRAVLLCSMLNPAHIRANAALA